MLKIFIGDGDFADDFLKGNAGKIFTDSLEDVKSLKKKNWNYNNF